jgi:hypothetical protein
MGLTLLATTDIQIIRVVEALYNQKPGNTYLENFKTYVASESLDGFANLMGASFSSQSDAEFAAVITGNLGLTGDALTAGNAYLEGQFAANPAARGKVVLDAMNELSSMESDPTFGAVATAYNANVVASYEYSANTANTQVGVPGAGATYTLTNGTDVLTGTTGGDTFTASYTTASGMTYQSGDSVDGGAGDDALNITVGTTGTAQAASITNVEAVKGTFSAAGTVSLLGATGITSVNASGSTAAAIISNLSADVANLTMENTSQNATFTYQASAVTGSSDSTTLTVANVTAGTATVAAIETINIVSNTGPNVLTALTAAAATTLNISGDQTLDLGTANTVATTIDANAMTAALTVISDNAADTTITGGAGNDSITETGTAAAVETINGGAGDDTITFTANLGATDVINGGDGTDTLVSTDALLAALTVPTTGALITNLESVTISDESASVLTLANIQAGITTLTLASTGDGGATDAITDAANTITGEAGSLTINLGAKEAGNLAAVDGILTINDTGEATTDSLTINNTSIDSTTGSNVNLANTGGSGVAAEATFLIGGYESVTFNTGSGSGNVEQDLNDITINPDTVTTDVSLTITGNNALDLDVGGVITNSTGVLTIDASGMKAQVTGTTTFDIATTSQGTAGTAVITGSGGEDIIVVGNFASTINGGAGLDAITGGTAADTISGGAGNDTLVGSGGNDTINGDDGDDTITASTTGDYTVTGGAGDDTLDLGGTATQLDSFDGGEGTDTLIVNNTSVTAINALSVSNLNIFNAGLQNVERVDFGTTLNASIDMGRIDNISDIIIGALGGASTVSGLAATNAVQILADTGATLALDLATSSGTSDVVNIDIKASGTVNANTITIANTETVNITNSFSVAGTDEAGKLTTMALVATKATSITVTGDEGLVLTNTGNTKVTNFDASGVVATTTADTATNMAVTFTSENTSTTATVSITGGAGDDALTGNASIDTIIGGLGADTITASAGNDVITGGAGADTFQFTAALLAANSGTTATFDGGAGTDILTITDTGATIVDADFRGITSVATLNTGNGTNAITLASGADATGIATLTGGTGKDTINISSVDFDNTITITAGANADTVTLGAQTATVKFTSTSAAAFATESAVDAGTDNDFSAGIKGDKISGFTSGTDKLKFAAAAITSAIGTEVDTLKSIGAGGTIANTDRFVELTATQTNAQMGTIITAINALTTTAVAIADSCIIFAHDGNDGYLYLLEQDSAADTVTEDDVTLIAQLTGVTDIANGDLVSF